MTALVLGLGVLAFLLSLVITRVLIPVGHRLGTLDSAGVAGQVKEAPRRVPNTGGIAIFWAIAAPIALGLLLAVGLDASPDAPWRRDFSFIPADLHTHLAGIQSQAPLAGLMLGSALLLHILGLRDDRKALGPWLKLAIMACPPSASRCSRRSRPVSRPRAYSPSPTRTPGAPGSRSSLQASGSSSSPTR